MKENLPLKALRIGTRKSPLAQAQTSLVIDALKHSNCFKTCDINIVTFTTTGDKISNKPLYTEGGKGLFVKELEAALLSNEIDMAVHSLKDMETTLPPGLSLAAFLPRGDVEDVLLSTQGFSLDELPIACTVGTVSPRRKAQLLHHRLDLNVVPLRGNVGTRIAKLNNGEVDAIVLARAGLTRLGLMGPKATVLPTSLMLPAAGQGIIALQCRQSDEPLLLALQQLSDTPTTLCAMAERSMLQHLGGSCQTPIAAHATVKQNNLITLKGMLAFEDSHTPAYAFEEGVDPNVVGKSLAEKLQQMMKK
ncbi:MAG: hydroxymethylbilane synthase [Alphaproteobacteria bacterium]|nr:hydroxymethylbilane synthase [Alphaproteobacteria bacterium]OJV46358.1 MAG: hydroxymethylbilane synthase [Alphaproteobacteria bacterium 43-37]